MIRRAVNTALQNKNSVMFITTMVFVAGILSYFHDNAILCSAILTIAGVVAILRNYFDFKYVLFWLFMFYFGFFNSHFQINNSDDLLRLAPNKSTITGQIVTIPNSNVKDKTKFFFKVNKIDDKIVNAKTLVTINDENGDFKEYNIGDFYELKGNLRLPFKAGNPSQFDYGKYLRNFDTFTVFYTNKSDTKYIDNTLSFKWEFLQSLNNLRNKIIATHAENLKSPNLEILGGIVFGDDAVAPPDYIKSSFINSGLLHILAASGMNVAFIFGFWFFILNRFKVPYKIINISGIGLIIFYTLMTGLGPSVIRAALMLIIILIGKLIDRSTHSVSLLALVALLMLIYNPAFINDVGFQLSFLVTFGLLTTGTIIFEKLQDTKIPQWLSGAAIIPVVAQIWVAPLQMFYFNTFSTYSIFANISSMPFLSVVSFGGFMSSILAIFMPFTKYLCMSIDFCLNYVLTAIVMISNFFAEMPNSLISTTHPSIMQILIYYTTILLITLIIKIGLNKKIVIASFFLLFTLGVSMISIPNGKLEIITFDVQNADAFLIKTPKNKYFMIDTGKAGYKGGKSQAEIIILKYLKDRGIKNIEGLIITHFDSDHSGGAADVINNLKVNKVYLGSMNDNSFTSQNIYKALKNQNVTTVVSSNNSEIYTDEDLVIKTYLADSKEDNENSIITLLNYKNFNMLFMGDAGIYAFDKVRADIPQNINILKVGHHGAAKVVDNKMLNHLNNQISIISVGSNIFGHPYKGTLDTLRKTDIYRTDKHNSVKIVSDGNIYNLLTYDKEKRKYSKSKQIKIKD